MAARRPAARIAQLWTGGLLIAVAIVFAPLPGAVFVLAGGLILVLRNSRAAQLRFVRAKRRWPRIGHAVDRTMRRPSALRRHARNKARQN